MAGTSPDPETARDAAEHESEAFSDQVPGRDGGPVDPEDMRAAEGLEPSEEVSANYAEMLKRGAATEGEGRVP
jgi:hypothetical protein